MATMNQMPGMLPPGATPELLDKLHAFQAFANRVTCQGHTNCFKVCVGQFHDSEPNMNPAEIACMDRCMNKFFEAHLIVKEKRKALDAQAGGA